jgi:hypothetical protein
MADPKENQDDIAIVEGQDGSATVDLPENMLNGVDGDDQNTPQDAKNEGGSVDDDDADHPDDDDELRAAKRSRRRAKKDLIRQTNQEKDIRLSQLQRENEEFKRRLSQLERNSKSADLVRIDKGLEDAQTRLEYAKMKLAEATQNGDGQAMVEAQTMLARGARGSAPIDVPAPAGRPRFAQTSTARQPIFSDPDRSAEWPRKWMRRNKWYNPAATDTDSRIAKKH